MYEVSIIQISWLENDDGTLKNSILMFLLFSQEPWGKELRKPPLQQQRVLQLTPARRPPPQQRRLSQRQHAGGDQPQPHSAS